jgi:hypothetical protein
MRLFRTFATIAALAFSSISAASASTVIVTFSGTFTYSDIPVLAEGTPFSGTVTYGTDLPLVGGSVETGSVQYGLPAGALTIAADGTVANINPNFPLLSTFLEETKTNPGFGDLDFAAFFLAGTGPLDGGGAKLDFGPSADPAVAALQIPYPFPTEFALPDLTVSVGGVYAEGTITFSTQNIPENIPEPSTWAMLLVGLGFAGRRESCKRIASGAG